MPLPTWRPPAHGETRFTTWAGPAMHACCRCWSPTTRRPCSPSASGTVPAGRPAAPAGRSARRSHAVRRPPPRWSGNRHDRHRGAGSRGFPAAHPGHRRGDGRHPDRGRGRSSHMLGRSRTAKWPILWAGRLSNARPAAPREQGWPTTRRGPRGSGSGSPRVAPAPALPAQPRPWYAVAASLGGSCALRHREWAVSSVG